MAPIPRNPLPHGPRWNRVRALAECRPRADLTRMADWLCLGSRSHSSPCPGKRGSLLLRLSSTGLHAMKDRRELSQLVFAGLLSVAFHAGFAPVAGASQPPAPVPAFAWLEVAEGDVEEAEASAISRHLAVDADGIATDVKDDESGSISRRPSWRTPRFRKSVERPPSVPMRAAAPNGPARAGSRPAAALQARLTELKSRCADSGTNGWFTSRLTPWAGRPLSFDATTVATASHAPTW